MLREIESRRRRGPQRTRLVGWHHRLNKQELEETPGASEGQGSLACCSPWGCKESNTTEPVNHHHHAPPAFWASSPDTPHLGKHNAERSPSGCPPSPEHPAPPGNRPSVTVWGNGVGGVGIRAQEPHLARSGDGGKLSKARNGDQGRLC